MEWQNLDDLAYGRYARAVDGEQHPVAWHEFALIVGKEDLVRVCADAFQRAACEGNTPLIGVDGVSGGTHADHAQLCDGAVGVDGECTGDLD